MSNRRYSTASPCKSYDRDQLTLALDQWRHRWHCPSMVELNKAGCTLRLDLDEPAPATILHAHLTRHGHATLTETVAAPADYG